MFINTAMNLQIIPPNSPDSNKSGEPNTLSRIFSNVIKQFENSGSNKITGTHTIKVLSQPLLGADKNSSQSPSQSTKAGSYQPPSTGSSLRSNDINKQLINIRSVADRAFIEEQSKLWNQT
jgi:hypothetical protein